MTTPSFSAMETVFVRLANKHRSTKDKYNHRVYVATYGVSVQVTTKIWHVMKSDIQDNKIARGLRPCHLLWALYLLKQYDSSIVMSNYCECADKTFRKWTWIVVQLLAALCDQNVSNFFAIIYMHHKQTNLPFLFRFCSKGDW